MSAMDEAVAELEEEQREIDELLTSLSPDQWRLATPAAGWDVRDQVSHLADTNEVAYDTMTGGARPLNDAATSFSSPEEFTEAGCERGRAMDPAQVLAWWRDTAALVNTTLRAKDPKERIPWGLGMAARTFVTARHMEHWAHALDIRNAIGAPIEATPRLRNVAWLIVNAFPYAFVVAGITPPPGAVRAELTFDGDTWVVGREDADNVISGDALEFCMLGVQRVRRDEATTLTAKGELAELALTHARAFL